VDSERKKVGLCLNGSKVKLLAYNIDNPPPLCTSDGTEIEWKTDFKYLGSWVNSSEGDIAVRKALSWQASMG